MKELKFRVWDGVKFIYSFTETGKDRLGWFFTTYKDKNVEQFIGKKDKNGVDIYEGDFLRILGDYAGDTYYEECFAEVIFQDTQFEFINTKYMDESVMQPFLWEEVEIVGNLYSENKRWL